MLSRQRLQEIITQLRDSIPNTLAGPRQQRDWDILTLCSELEARLEYPYPAIAVAPPTPSPDQMVANGLEEIARLRRSLKEIFNCTLVDTATAPEDMVRRIVSVANKEAEAALRAPATTSSPETGKKYEYATVYISGTSYTRHELSTDDRGNHGLGQLNELGSKGWEMVGVYPGTNFSVIYLQREIKAV